LKPAPKMPEQSSQTKEWQRGWSSLLLNMWG